MVYSRRFHFCSIFVHFVLISGVFPWHFNSDKISFRDISCYEDFKNYNMYNISTRLLRVVSCGFSSLLIINSEKCQMKFCFSFSLFLLCCHFLGDYNLNVLIKVAVIIKKCIP